MEKQKGKERMIDNRMIRDTHQEGIGRVLQKRSDKKDLYGHSGKMGGRTEKADWGRKGNCLTPKKA